jgi:hypothetical protein
MPLDNMLQAMDMKKKLLFTVRRSRKSEIFLEVELAGGVVKEAMSIDEIVDLLPEATVQDLKNFACFIYLFARG